MTLRGLTLLTLGLTCAGGCTGQGQPISIPPPARTQPVAAPKAGGSSVRGGTRVIDGVTHTVTITMQNAPPGPGGSALTGAPYSADDVQERVRTLADGTRLTEKRLLSRTYRDSEGRQRREMPFPPGADPYSPPPAVSITIYDPVMNIEYMLEPRAGIAHLWDLSKIPSPETMFLAPIGISSGEGLPPSPPPRRMPASRPAMPQTQPPNRPAPARAPSSQPVRPAPQSERLGTQVIDGLTVEGTRITVLFPPGTQGNDRPIVVVNEQWRSPELQVTVLSKISDPRIGESTRTLIHLSRAEPDLTLFQPPPDYRVVEEKVTFTINHQVLP